jgi:transitional endoplasmic reticulum ATPase
MKIQLSPAQQLAYDSLMYALSLSNVLTIVDGDGSGATTVLTAIRDETGGAMLSLKDFIDAMRSRHPLAMEETFYQLVLDALMANAHVLVDDIGLLINVCSGCGTYPRAGLFEAPITALCNYAAQSGRKLILNVSRSTAARHRGFTFGIGEFKPADYQFLCSIYLPTSVQPLDYDKIYRFAPKLNAHQLRAACIWMGRDANLDTNGFINYLKSQYLASNVDLSEVQPIKLHDLKGVDDVIKSLEANIILPLENDALSAELGLKPKRGVLLAGPPGTGKTSIGRALAHRLQSKFFLLDGTFISGTSHFYHHVSALFEEAKRNAPSILFIDDCDAIFESGEEMGLYRYLLTMLDGLESASAGRVCVMLTAMDISHLPPALIRSGRVELWLEMSLPDSAARAEILCAHLSSVASLAGQVDLSKVADAADGFTGADLKRLVEDGKLLLAQDRAAQQALKPATDYFLAATASVRQNRERYAAAEAQARQQRQSGRRSPNMPPSRPDAAMLRAYLTDLGALERAEAAHS